MEPKGLMMIGAVLIGGFVALTSLNGAKVTLPATAVTSLGSRPLDHDRQIRGDGAAADYLVARAWGVIAEGPVATHDRSPAVFIGDAIADWRPADEDEVVGRVQMLLDSPDCAMPAPAAGADVVNLLVEHPASKSGLYSFTDAELLTGVHDWFRNIRGGEPGKTATVPWPKKDYEYRVHDIAVTETGRPVHLVVQNPSDSHHLYNFHLAPGAIVAGVSMLGGSANAVANLPEGVPVAVMTRLALEACGIRVQDKARGEAALARVIRDKPYMDDDEIAAARAALDAEVAAYDGWFQGQFAIPSVEGRIGLSYAEVSLIGPVPDDPGLAAVAYRPLAGAYVVVQAEDYLKVEGLHAWPQAYRDEVTRLGGLIAGGDPDAIVRPARMTREY